MNKEKLNRELNSEFSAWWKTINERHIEHQMDALIATHGAIKPSEAELNALFETCPARLRRNQAALTRLGDQVAELTKSKPVAGAYINADTARGMCFEYAVLKARIVDDKDTDPKPSKDQFDTLRQFMITEFAKTLEIQPIQAEQAWRDLDRAADRAIGKALGVTKN